MVNISNQCQATGCSNPAIIKLKTVPLCGDHVDEVNQQVDGSYQRFYTLDAETIREMVETLPRDQAA